MNQIKQSGADAVFLGGLTDENGAQVIKDKVAVLGPNDGEVKLLAPDGFTQQSTIDEAGVENAKGMFMSVAGVPVEELTGDGATFIEEFQAELGDEPVDPYAAYGAQAAVVLLDAIAAGGCRSRGGDRGDVRTRRSRTGSSAASRSTRTATRPSVEGGIVNFIIYRAEAELVPETQLAPKQETIDAARGT